MCAPTDVLALVVMLACLAVVLYAFWQIYKAGKAFHEEHDQ